MKKVLVLMAVASLVLLASCSTGPTESRWAGEGVTFNQGAQKVADAYWSGGANLYIHSGFAVMRSFYYDDDGVQAVGTVVMVDRSPGWMRRIQDIYPHMFPAKGHPTPPGKGHGLPGVEGDAFPPHVKGDPDPPMDLREFTITEFNGHSDSPVTLSGSEHIDLNGYAFTSSDDMSGDYTLEEFEELFGSIDAFIGGGGGGRLWKCESYTRESGHVYNVLCIWHASSGLWACRVRNGKCSGWLPTTY